MPGSTGRSALGGCGHTSLRDPRVPTAWTRAVSELDSPAHASRYGCVARLLAGTDGRLAVRTWFGRSFISGHFHTMFCTGSRGALGSRQVAALPRHGLLRRAIMGRGPGRANTQCRPGRRRTAVGTLPDDGRGDNMRVVPGRGNRDLGSGSNGGQSTGGDFSMASKRTLNAANLEALGARRLAELLVGIASGNRAARRRLRLELAAVEGPEALADEIRNRLATIGRARAFLDWRKRRDLAADLEIHRETIGRASRGSGRGGGAGADVAIDGAGEPDPGALRGPRGEGHCRLPRSSCGTWRDRSRRRGRHSCRRSAEAC